MDRQEPPALVRSFPNLPLDHRGDEPEPRISKHGNDSHAHETAGRRTAEHEECLRPGGKPAKDKKRTKRHPQIVLGPLLDKLGIRQLYLFRQMLHKELRFSRHFTTST